MESLVMIKDGKYNIRLVDVFFSFLQLKFYCEEILKVEEETIMEYALKHMNDDVPNFMYLALNIALDMEKNGEITDTMKLREDIVRMEIMKVYSEDEFYKMIMCSTDFIKKMQDKDVVRNIKIQRKVIEYFEKQLLNNILKQNIELILHNTSAKKIKITIKTSDALYDSSSCDTLQMLKEDIMAYFLQYHYLDKMMEVVRFEDYLIITLKNPLTI